MKEQLYFHSPCFDGIASAVLLVDYLRAQGRTDVHLQPVNYHLRANWLTTPLERPAAVVDFLYHPDATFWADHHATAFLTDAARVEFEARQPDRRLVYDRQADSCAGLLWRHLATQFEHCNPRLEELVRWAEKIDAARYDSVAEALASDVPAMRLNASLAAAPSVEEHCVNLVRALAERSVAEVAAQPEVSGPADQVLSRQRQGLETIRGGIRLTDDRIAVFDVSDDSGAINRYSPYHVFPEARYSAGIIRGRQGMKITSMRNPWKEFDCAPLGKLCEALGGGGHERVGSIALANESGADPADLLARLIAGIRAFEASRPS